MGLETVGVEIPTPFPRMAYADAMEAWRSNCPRHPVWEDALAEGLVQVENGATLDGSRVSLTERGRAVLRESAPRYNTGS